MILMGCMATSGCIPVKSKPFEATFPTFSVYSSLNSTPTTHLSVKNWCGASSPHSRGLLLRGELLKPTFSNAPPSLSTGCHGSFIFPIILSSVLQRSRRGTSKALRASKDVPTTYHYSESHGSFSFPITSPSVLRRSSQETSMALRAPKDVPTTYRYPEIHGSFSFPITSPFVLRQSRQGTLMTPRASKDVPTSYRYPPMTKKPRWWWRTLACIPYLMPLHETWMYAETAYHLHPFLEDFEFLTYPFLRFIGTLPGWFLMAYFFVAYLGVVRRKEWPHFFRFHVVMGMLLEITLQVVGTVSWWLPMAIYWGKIGMHFWTFVSFGYLFTVLECIRCALGGMYADVPFASDAAYIQIPYD